MVNDDKSIPTISVSYVCNGSSAKVNELGMRPMQERAYERRGEQYLLIKSPPASGKSRALMFIALDKLYNQGLKKAIIVVPGKSIGSSFNDEPLKRFGFWSDWRVDPKWNLCNAPGTDNGGKVNSVGAFLECDDKVLVCTHATFRFAVDKFGVEAFDNSLIAVDEFHHVSSNPDNKLGLHLGQFIARDRVHIVAMTGSYFRGDAEAVLAPQDESKFDAVTYTYYEQLNGYEYLKQLDIGYFFYSGSYIDDILKVLNPGEKTIIHIPNVNSRESTKDKIGVTGGKVETRIANAVHDATYLLADVEVVASYKLAGINRTKLEGIFHRIFASAQLDLVIHDRFGHPVRPLEWFLVPLHVIDEAVHHIQDGSITNLVYDPKKACFVNIVR